MRPSLLKTLLLLTLCNVHVLSAPAETKLQKLRLRSARAPLIGSDSKDAKDQKGHGHGHDPMSKSHDDNEMKHVAQRGQHLQGVGGGGQPGGGEDDEMAWYPIDDDDYRPAVAGEETNRGKVVHEEIRKQQNLGKGRNEIINNILSTTTKNSTGSFRTICESQDKSGKCLKSHVKTFSKGKNSMKNSGSSSVGSGTGGGDGATRDKNNKENVMSMTIDQLLDTVKDILDKGNKKGLSGQEVDKLSGVMSLITKKVHELEKKQKSCEEASEHSGINSGSGTGNKDDKNVKEVEEHGNLEIKIYKAGGRAGASHHHVEQHEKKEEEEVKVSSSEGKSETEALGIGVYQPPSPPPSPPKTPNYFVMPPDVNYNGGINRHMDDMKQQWPQGHWPDQDNQDQGQDQGQMSMNAYYHDLNRNRNTGNLDARNTYQIQNRNHQIAGRGNLDARNTYQVQDQNQIAGSGNFDVRKAYQIQNQQNQNAGSENYLRGIYVSGPAVPMRGGGVAYYGEMTGAGAGAGTGSESDQNDFQVMNMQQHFLNANSNTGKVGRGKPSRNMD